MKTNNLFTYILYGMLGLLILAAAYKACDMQKEKQRKAQEEAELQKTLQDMGFNNDTTDTGSTYVATDTSSTPSATTSAPAPTGTNTKGTATQGTTTTAKTTSPPKTVAAPSATGTTTAKTPTKTPSKTTSKGAPKVAGPGSGRWAVRAGTFSSVEGARRRLEQVIKAGYPNAEISKTTGGLSAVVVYRSNDKTAAIRVADKLEDKDIDAAVFDRQKQE
jgi:cytoskeletal protein RodZ